jgi:periplasmic protein TonB
VREAVDRIIQERRDLDRGFANSVYLSLAFHLLAVGGAFGAQLVLPRKPVIEVADVFFEPLPRGGRGTPNVPPPAPAPSPSDAGAGEEPPKVLQPPTPPKPEEREDALPEPSATPRKKPTPRPKVTPAPGTGVAMGAGTGNQTPGLEFAPPGLGVPGGTDRHGDYYLAGVQQKIWMIWTQRIHEDVGRTVKVQFTIHKDGSLSDVRVVESSGGALLDLAAQRAVQSAAPFAPFPNNYGQDRITIQAVFKPTG